MMVAMLKLFTTATAIAECAYNILFPFAYISLLLGTNN